MRVGIGADHRGAEVQAHLTQLLRQQGHEVPDAPTADDRPVDYPDVSYPIARGVGEGTLDRGVLIDGTGIGVCIAANKIKGVRAALVHDEIGADLSRRQMDANVLCLSADMLGIRIIDRIVQTWLATEFEGGRHGRRVDKIKAMEQGATPSGDPVAVREEG